MSVEQAMQSTATAIQAASNSAGAYLSKKEAKKQIEADRTFNAEQAELARQWSTNERLASQEFNLDMWNRNNEYNSPVEQMKRMKEAGINPNAIKGDPNVASSPVTTSAGSSSMASNSSGASFVAPSMSQSATNTSAFASLLESYANVKRSDIEQELGKWELKYNKKTEELRVKQLETNIKYQEEQINDVIESAGMKRASKEEILARTSWMDKLNDSEIQEKVARTTLLYNQSYEILKSLELQEKDIDSQIDLRSSQKSLNESTATLQGQQGSYIDNQSKTEDVERALLEIEKKFAEEMGMPIGSTDEQFYFKLWKAGQLPSFIDEVLVNTERSKWKPYDWRAPAGTYARSYNFRTGVFNPKWKSSEAEYNLIDRKTTSESFRNFKP